LTCVRDTVGILVAKIGNYSVRTKYSRKELTKYNNELNELNELYMTHDMKHNDMKRNNGRRDTMFTTRRHHAGCGHLLRTLLLLVMTIVGSTGA